MKSQSRRNFFRQFGAIAAAPVAGAAAVLGLSAPKEKVKPFERGEMLTHERLNAALGLNDQGR